MTLRDIITNGKGRAGSNGAWHVEANGTHRRLWHYGTLMLHWSILRDGRTHIIDWSEGHGSVSDQGGMNTAFRALGVPYRYSRDARGGGPRVEALPLHPCGCVTDPAIPRCTCATAQDMAIYGLAA